MRPFLSSLSKDWESGTRKLVSGTKCYISVRNPFPPSVYLGTRPSPTVSKARRERVDPRRLTNIVASKESIVAIVYGK